MQIFGSLALIFAGGLLLLFWILISPSGATKTSNQDNNDGRSVIKALQWAQVRCVFRLPMNTCLQTSAWAQHVSCSVHPFLIFAFSQLLLQIALVMAPAVFVGAFDGPGWASCVLWAFAAALLRIVNTSKSANYVPCLAIFLVMVTVISCVDGEFA
jgi:hypothetical protein